MTYTQNELDEILRKHKLWLDDDPAGERANLEGSSLEGANLDYSCWPLWCGSLNAKGDNRLIRQMLYHTIRFARATDILSPDLVRALSAPDLIAQANQFHRANECGLLEEGPQ